MSGLFTVNRCLRHFTSTAGCAEDAMVHTVPGVLTSEATQRRWALPRTMNLRSRKNTNVIQDEKPRRLRSHTQAPHDSNVIGIIIP
uniref:Secreted protein n=1 Tax=Steinernema glaseri TaxID=37863 RepID=A0A1I7YXE9_9BILA